MAPINLKPTKIVCLVMIACSFISCNTTKYVPQGQYMVDEVSLDVDTRDISSQDLMPFIKQQSNNSAFEIGIYNYTYNSKSFIKKWLAKLGKPPVIYDDRARIQSVNEIHIEMKNRGYLNAEVTSSVDSVNKKAKILYHVTSNAPYRIRDYKIDISNKKIDRILERMNGRRNRSRIRQGNIFDMYVLENERSRISDLLRNIGYYSLTEDNLHYLADTTLRSNEVDLTMILKDSTILLQPYKIRSVSVFSGYDPLNLNEYDIKDSTSYRGLNIYYNSLKFLRPHVLSSNILMRPGQLFSTFSGDRTYNYLKDLKSISRVNIQYEEVVENDSAALDCKIYITPGNIHGIQMGLDGTNKAGDLGIAANIAYTHNNIFNGSEVLGIKLRGAYEFVGANNSAIFSHNFYEFGIGTTLGFPKAHIPFVNKLSKNRFKFSTEYGIGFNIQNRPEYIREFFNLSWKTKWNNLSNTVSQTLNLVDINYVMMPWVSESFEDYLNSSKSQLIRYSYENIFIAGISYGLVFTNNNTGRFRQRLYTIRLNLEESGNVLGGIFSLANAKKSDSDQYNILGNPFAQYVKGDIDFSQTQRVTEKGTIAYRAGIGVAYPYGNSAILPFEKRYYAGGPNSVRGWSTRLLGPGSYNEDISNLSTHVGDIKLIMSLEYRYKILKWLELATFTDAGNIWTIKEYAYQPGGMFDFSTFYKELAVGFGAGIRLDLGFLIVRLDSGKKVYDPAKEQKNRWVFFDKFKDNWGVYLAIGYPF